MGYTPWGPRPQDPDTLRPTTLARSLDVSPETIRDRIEGMEQAGVIQTWEAYPNPRLIGLDVGGWAFQPPGARTAEEALEDVLLVDGVLEVLTYRGPFVAVALAYAGEAERDRRLALIGRQLEDPDPVHLLDAPMPEADHDPDRLDLAIVAALRGQARRPLREVAEGVEASYRTVKRRYDKMTGSGALFIVPRVSLAHVSGILPFTLVLRLEPGAGLDPVHRIARTLDDRVLHRLLPVSEDPKMAALGAFAETVAGIDRIEHEAEAVEGIDRAFTVLSKSRHATDWIDTRLAALLEARA